MGVRFGFATGLLGQPAGVVLLSGIATIEMVMEDPGLPVKMDPALPPHSGNTAILWGSQQLTPRKRESNPRLRRIVHPPLRRDCRSRMNCTTS